MTLLCYSCSRRTPAEGDPEETRDISAIEFWRHVSGDLEPVCTRHVMQAMNDGRGHVSIEDGMDEWIVQEVMTS